MKEANKLLIKVNKQLTRRNLTDPLWNEGVPTPPQLRETILELAEHLEDLLKKILKQISELQVGHGKGFADKFSTEPDQMPLTISNY